MQHRSTRLSVLVLAAAGALAGCGSNQAATTTTTAPATSTSTSTTTAPTTTSAPATTPSTTTASTPTTTVAGAKPIVVLEAGGLGFLVGSSSIRHLPFASTDKATIRTALVNALGAPVKEQDQSCGSGPIHSMRWAAITVYVGSDKLVGWFVSAGATPKTTSADGIGIGTTLATLRKAHPDVKVEKTSLGDEWSVGTDLGGTLTKNASTGTINAIFSGDACIAR
jgi:hypothetical protein